MAFQNNTFQSGKEYTLAHLFSQNHKIIIPDLQRDYCWGDMAWDKDATTHTELVSGFLNNLLEIYQEFPNNDLTMGLIYGYESPKLHIQLCDGQQRITTLFLILGILNRKTQNNFQHFLISDEELEDDNEPYLQYAIRESTLYFLSDLVCKYFLKSENEISFLDIKKSSWYFAEYNLDASIRSMMNAIQNIEKEFDKNPDVDFIEFGNFILNNLQMLYYDMENRIRGEETFVVINTTGEPLSATENLKPILIGNIKDDEKRKIGSDEWEEREEWFWQNRRQNEATADDGINQFFIWYWQIRLLQERTWKNKKPELLNPRELFTKKPKIDVENEENPELERWEESINTKTIHSYYIALKELVHQAQQENISKVLHSIKSSSVSLGWFRDSDLDVVLPLISYLEKFPKAQFLYEFVRRIRKNYFDKIRKRGNEIDWRHLIQIIEFSETEKDVLMFNTKENENKFKNISNKSLHEWYNEDEKNKNVLKENYKTEIENWENHIDLMGDLSPLWKANEDSDKNYENIKRIYYNFDLLYNCYFESECKNNPILSNYFRLYQVFLENFRIGHIERTSGMLGSEFSRKSLKDNKYLEYLNSPAFISLLSFEQNDMLNEIKARLKGLFPKDNFTLTDDNFKAKRHLKCWLFIKTLQAEKMNILLSFVDHYGITTYFDSASNKLNKALPFSLANSICGYGKKSGGGYGNVIDYATDWWGNQGCFDTTIGNFINLQEFQKREKSPISPETIKNIEVEIENLLEDFYN